MALAGIKLDTDGNSGFATNCFPVRSVVHRDDDGGGAWALSHKAEQRRRFKAVLCTKPKTFSQIREERKKCEKEGTSLTESKFEDKGEEEEEDAPNLNGFFLLKHCCVDDPSDLCSINISGQGFMEVEDEDLTAFDNVAYVNAAENYLPIEAYRGFPILRELEIPLCGLRNLKIGYNDFPYLELLDLSYNNLSQEDILTVGTLPCLKVLHLTGCDFTHLPHDFCIPFKPEGRKSLYARFSQLEVLMLDENKLSDITIFAALAGLKKLKHLNLEKNEIFFVPQLKSVQGQMQTQEGEDLSARQAKTRTPSSSRASKRSKSRQSLLEAKLEELTQSVLLQEQAIPEDNNTAEDITTGEINLIEEKPEAALEGNENTEIPDTTECTETKETKNELLEEDFSLTLGDLSARIHDVESDIKGTPTPKLTARKTEPDPIARIPFPELRYLSLAHNQISTEEGLLAVAAWPMLAELVIHNNPLTTENVGDPPLLKRFLHDRLGIKLVRKEIKPELKRLLEIPDRPKRRVTTQVPKVPKPTLEQRLMLEAPKPAPVTTGVADDTRPSTSSRKTPLPPIDPTRHRARSAGARSAGSRSHQAEYREVTPIDDAWLSEDELGSETFFMTQVDDQSVEERDREEESGREKKQKPIHAKYRGYEDLLTEDDVVFDDEECSKDIQSNVRALRYALNHQLVYRDTKSLQLNVVKKPVKEYRRVPLPPPGPKKTKQERIDDALDNLKNRSTVDEASLKYVLQNKARMRKQFPEAENLLAQIQHRYNAVRVTSMKEAKDSKHLVQESLNSNRAASKLSSIKAHH